MQFLETDEGGRRMASAWNTKKESNSAMKESNSAMKEKELGDEGKRTRRCHAEQKTN